MEERQNKGKEMCAWLSDFGLSVVIIPKTTPRPLPRQPTHFFDLYPNKCLLELQRYMDRPPIEDRRRRPNQYGGAGKSNIKNRECKFVKRSPNF